MKFKGVKNFLYSTLIAATSLFHSCEDPNSDSVPPTKKPSAEQPPDNSEEDIYDNVYILENSDLEKIIYYDYETIGFSSQQDYSVGDIISGGISEKTPYGFLSKITYATDDKKSFKIDMNTSLDEAVKNGECSSTKNWTYNDLISKSSNENFILKNGNGNYNFHFDINEVIYDADKNPITINDQIILEGYSDFSIITDTKIKITDGKPHAKFESTFTGESDVKLISNLDIVQFDKKIPLEELYFNPISFLVGPIPVVLLPKASLNFYLDVNFESKIETEISNNFESKNTLELKNGDWTLTKAPTNYSNTTPLKTNIDFDANASASLSPELGLEFYGLAGPYANLKIGTTFHANTTENPWWTWNAWANANIGFDVTKITKSAKNFEKTIPLLEDILIAEADGAFPGNENPPEENLDSLVIQPGPEGKDAWLVAGKISNPECTKTSDYSSTHPNDSIIKSSFQYTTGCGFAEDRTFIQFPLDNIPKNSEIVSARLDLYGFTSSNNANNLPTFSFSKITEPWDEQNITWQNQPQTSLIKKVDFPNGKIQWNSVDVTSTIQDQISGESNYGFEISTTEDMSGGNFYSSDNPDSEFRPKLVVYYKE